MLGMSPVHSPLQDHQGQVLQLYEENISDQFRENQEKLEKFKIVNFKTFHEKPKIHTKNQAAHHPDSSASPSCISPRHPHCHGWCRDRWVGFWLDFREKV